MQGSGKLGFTTDHFKVFWFFVVVVVVVFFFVFLFCFFSGVIGSLHYDNTPIQLYGKFQLQKHNFQMKEKLIFFSYFYSKHQ